MKQVLDARGKTCPMPVIETMKVLSQLHEGDSLEVAVDNYIAVQNLTKMANQKKLPVSAEKIDETHYRVTVNMISSGDDRLIEKAEKQVCIPDSRTNDVVIALSSDKMGEGDEKLGRVLMKGFIYALTEQEQLPQAILLYNTGAYLSAEGSDSLADLKLLEAQGTEILTCGTCLNHYGLSDKLGAGSVTNMYTIVEKLMQASKVVKP